MRVLFVTCHLPHPPVSGGRLRESELLRRIAARGVHVDVCVVSKTPRADRRHAQTFRRLLGRDAAVTVCSTRPHPDGPAQVARHASADAPSYVAHALATCDYDVLHVEGFYLMQHLPPQTPPVLLVEQNVEFELWRQRGDETEAVRTRRAEVAAWRRATLCAAVTAADRLLMHAAAPDVPVLVVPDGADHLQNERDVGVHLHRRSRRSALFVGNFAYAPNLDGARWLLDDIWPCVRGGRLALVGNAPPTELRERARASVTVTGRARSLAPYYAEAEVVVCPLRIGGGVKVKMLEALSLGKPIVSTPVGVQGLEDAPVLVESDAAGFAEALTSLLADQRARDRLARSAREYARTLPTWDEAATALISCYEAVVRSKSAAWPWPTPTQSVASP